MLRMVVVTTLVFCGLLLGGCGPATKDAATSPPADIPPSDWTETAPPVGAEPVEVRPPTEPVQPGETPPTVGPRALPRMVPMQRPDEPATAPDEPFPEAPLVDEPLPEIVMRKEMPTEEAYTTKEVFFATDRAMLDPTPPDWRTRLRAFRLPILATIVAMASLLLGPRFLGRRGAGVLTTLCGVVAVVSLFVIGYGSWREVRSGQREGVFFGNGRGTLAYGTCQVTIPRTHATGQLESPSIWRFEFFEDPKKHIVFAGATVMPADSFFGQVRQRVEACDSSEAFVFVHGFNVSFEDAARRTAQIAYDLDFQGAPIFFSWPSQAGLLQYTIDENNVEWTVPHLKQFLVELAEKSGARNISLVAHSMGNRALTNALRQLSYELTGAAPFREIVLTAPDIDADIFRRDIAPAIQRMGRRVTLYASSSDSALQLSKQIHGFPRAGESGPGLIVVPGIDTIDVSGVDTSLIGHSYYGSSQTVLSDLISLIRDAKPPHERIWLRASASQGLIYWVLDRAANGGLAPAPL